MTPGSRLSIRRGIIAPGMSWLIPCVLVACAAAPHPQKTAQPPIASQQPSPTAPDSDATYHFMMGHQAELSQDIDTALKEYHAALKIDPKSREVQSRLAAIYFALGDLPQAVQYAEEVGQGTGQEPQMLTQMAGILASAGKPERALELLDKAIDSAPERGESYFPKRVDPVKPEANHRGGTSHKKGATVQPGFPNWSLLPGEGLIRGWKHRASRSKF
ncbi:MAG: tetratricopeptide repeat protein [Nitrospira sp.]|nr:tetratricopeptide repeat protein [Nitrospira sp.]